MSVRQDELMLGGRYQVMSLFIVPVREDERGLQLVALNVSDFDTVAVASIRLLPDEARELARRLVDVAHTVELSSKR